MVPPSYRRAIPCSARQDLPLRAEAPQLNAESMPRLTTLTATVLRSPVVPLRQVDRAHPRGQLAEDAVVADAFGEGRGRGDGAADVDFGRAGGIGVGIGGRIHGDPTRYRLPFFISPIR